MYYTYLLRCADGSLYAGITTDPARRLEQHRGALPGGARYTALRTPAGFAAVWSSEDRASASRLEYRLKRLDHAEKEAVVAGAALPVPDGTVYRRSPFWREGRTLDLERDGLRLRDAEASDVPTLVRWWNDGTVMDHAGFPRGLGISEETAAAQLAAGSDTDRRLMLLWEERPIGEMSFRARDRRTAEIGIKICEPSCQNRGLGRRALSLLIRALFARGYRTIVLDTMEENARARHVYERLGFRFLGLRTACWRDQTGRLRTAADYALTEADFRDYSGLD